MIAMETNATAWPVKNSIFNSFKKNEECVIRLTHEQKEDGFDDHCSAKGLPREVGA
jgi:hypothetical protein